MSEESTHAVPGDGQEPEQRRKTTQETTKNETHSADSEIIQPEPEPHKRKRNYVPKTPEECARSKILKRGSTPLRERFMSDMQYNSLSKTTQKNYLNAVFDFIAHYYKSPEKITDEEIREYFNYEINGRHLSTYSRMVHRAALLFLYEKTLNLSRPFLHIFHPKKDRRHREILSQQEVRYFFTLIDNLIFRVLTELMYACGLRYSEASHLTVHDIDQWIFDHQRERR
jgi:integrase